MTKKMEKLNRFIESTINGFSFTLEVAKKNEWTFVEFADVLDNDYQLCYGAVLFAEIYEEVINENERKELMHKLSEAKYSIRRQFIG